MSLFITVLRIGRSREYINHMDEPLLINIITLEYWRNLRSSFDFTDQTLENCVNVIHTDIIEIWNLYDRRRVSSHVPCCSDCSTEPVFVKQPIQNKYVPRRQRSGHTSWRRVAEVGVSHYK